MTTPDARRLRPVICDRCGDEVFGPWIPTDNGSLLCEVCDECLEEEAP